MIARSPRIVVALLGSLLAVAASASAECARVRWVNTGTEKDGRLDLTIYRES